MQSPSTVLRITDDTFDEVVLRSPLPVLVDFSAPWCAPCRVIAPVVAAIAETHAGRLRVGTSDVDVNVASATRYDIRNLPTLLLFVDGQVRARIVGAVPRAKLEETIKQVLGMGADTASPAPR